MLEGAERDRVWETFKAAGDGSEAYEAKAEGRVFPILRLTPLQQPDAS